MLASFASRIINAMTRKTTQLPKVNPGDYARWRKEFDDEQYVRRLLAKFEPPEAESIRSLLFAAHVGPRQLTRDQVRRIWPKLKLDTRINLTDYTIAWLTARLKEKRPKDKKAHRDDVDIAALLTAADIPGEEPSTAGWTAGAIKKRRVRARIHPSVFLWGPRFLLKRLFLSLVIAREPE